MAKVCIIGLGYVGLPLAVLCVQKGHTVYGIDKDVSKINKINKGINPIKDDDLDKALNYIDFKIKVTLKGDHEIKDSDVVLVCVPTPVCKEYKPNLSLLKSACEQISKNIKKGQLIIIESTIYPGTVEEVVKPILEKSGLKAGSDFYLAHCPERIDPGNHKWNISNIPRVVGAISKEGVKKAYEFYGSILDGYVIKLTSVKSAEATKIMENTFRDINIAFINEMAKSFDKSGIDIMEVIKGASTKPFAFMPHYPGLGVGGHCIPVDPYYLIEKARTLGFEHHFLSLAREINKSMPIYACDLIIDLINNLGKSIKGANIAVLGLAYKPDIEDMRESASEDAINYLKEKEANVIIYDPYILDKSNVNSLDEALNKSDYVIIATAHTEFIKINPSYFKEKCIKIILDGRNCLDKDKIKKLGIIYKGIGI